MAQAVAQITIIDLNDITISNTAPSSPTEGQLWLDTSAVPNILKKWSGTAWEPTGLSSSDIDKILADQNLKLTFNNIVGCTVSGNTVAKTAASGWNAGFSATKTFTNGEYIEYTVSQLSKAIMFGLSTTDADVNYTSIHFAIYQTSSNTLAIYEKGSNKGTKGTAVQIGDQLRVAIEDNTINYYQNGKLIYTSLTAPVLPMVLDVSISTTLTNVGNIQFGTLTAGLAKRIADAEQKITPGAITATVRSSTEYINDLGTKITAEEASVIAQTPTNVAYGFNGISKVVGIDIDGVHTINPADSTMNVNQGVTKFPKAADFRRWSSSTVPSFTAKATPAINQPRYVNASSGKGILFEPAIINVTTDMTQYVLQNTTGRMTVTPTTYNGYPAVTVKFGKDDRFIWKQALATTLDMWATGSCVLSDPTKAIASLFEVSLFVGGTNSGLHGNCIAKYRMDNVTGLVSSTARCPAGSVSFGLRYLGTTDLTITLYMPMLTATKARYNWQSGSTVTEDEVIRLLTDCVNRKAGTIDIKARLVFEPIRGTRTSPIKVRYIRDFIGGNSVNAYNHWVEIKAIRQGGENVALGKPVTGSLPAATGKPYSIVTDGSINSDVYAEPNSLPGTQQYVTVDLGQVYTDIAYTQVWHAWADGRNYNLCGHQVSEDGSNWVTLYDSNATGRYTEGADGMRHYINTPPKHQVLWWIGGWENNNSMGVFVTDGGVLRVHFGDGSSFDFMDVPLNQISQGTHIFTVTWDEMLIALYIDGVKIAEYNEPMLPEYLTKYMGIGGYVDKTTLLGGNSWNDWIEEVRISPVARPAADIAVYGADINTPLEADGASTAYFDFNNTLSGLKIVNGLTCKHGDSAYSILGAGGLEFFRDGLIKPYIKDIYIGSVAAPAITTYRVTVPSDFWGKDWKAAAFLRGAASVYALNQAEVWIESYGDTWFEVHTQTSNTNNQIGRCSFTYLIVV